MQLEPYTAVKLAHTLKYSYARGRLFDPEYNVKLGALYLSQSALRLRHAGGGAGGLQRRRESRGAVDCGSEL